MKRLRVVGVLLLALIPFRALSAEEKPAPPAEEPPNRSETIDCVRARTGFTVKTGRFEGDAIFTHAQTRDIEDSGADLYRDTLTAALAYGITDWLTAKAVLPLLVRMDPDPGSIESGFGDLGLEAKVSLRKDLSPIGFVPLVDVSAGLAVTFPTGDEDKGLGAGDATFAPYVSASYWFKEWIGLHGSAALRFESGERPVHTMQAIAEWVPFSRDLSLLAGFEMRRVGFDPAAWTFLPGVEYRVTKMISAGIGLPVGITDKAEDWGLIANVQLTF